jgi:glycolate oxidase iron-sulfur subunit
MTQIGTGTDIPVLHTVELVDWATGGPMPEAVKRVAGLESIAPARRERQAEPMH